MSRSAAAIAHLITGVPQGRDATLIFEEGPRGLYRVAERVEGREPPRPELLAGARYAVTVLSTIAAPFDTVLVVVSPDRGVNCVSVMGDQLDVPDPALLSFDPLDYLRPWMAGDIAVPDSPADLLNLED